MRGPGPLSALSFQLSASSGSTPELGLCLTHNLPTRGLCLQPPWLSKSSRLPSFSVLPAATQTEFHSKWGGGGGGNPGKRAGWLLSVPFRPAAGFLFHPRHRGTSGEEQPLAASGPTTPGGKPWILDLNRPKREKASCPGRRCALQPRTPVS